MMRLNKWLVFLPAVFLAIVLSAQTKEDLKKQKLEIEKEINYTTELLNKTEANKTKSLNYLRALESKIKSKEQLLITLNIETSLLGKQIKRTELSIIE
ncbi:MAG: peptidase M23, partial [Bacteroidota bacterium]|nr:peptidase M23 [Bacteroidota bacterium]